MSLCWVSSRIGDHWHMHATVREVHRLGKPVAQRCCISFGYQLHLYIWGYGLRFVIKFLDKGCVAVAQWLGRRSVAGGLSLIYGWHVTTLWVKRPLWVNQLGHSVFHPPGVGKWVVIHVIRWITRVATIKQQIRARHGCYLQAWACERGPSLQPIGCTPALSVTIAY